MLRCTISAFGRFCCKSRKSLGDNFPDKRQRDRRPSICVASIALPSSPVNLLSGYEVPRIFTRKSRLQPREFLISSAKGLLQQNRPISAVVGSRGARQLSGVKQTSASRRFIRPGRAAAPLCPKAQAHRLPFAQIPARMRDRNGRGHSPLMFAALMIGHHLLISAFCNAPSTSGVC